MNEDLVSLVNYISSHNLYLHVAKTQPTIIGSGTYVNMLNKMEVPLITINNTPVSYKDEVNNLGVIFGCTLSWRQHGISVVKKVFGSFAQAKRNLDCHKVKTSAMFDIPSPRLLFCFVPRHEQVYN